MSEISSSASGTFSVRFTSPFAPGPPVGPDEANEQDQRGDMACTKGA